MITSKQYDAIVIGSNSNALTALRLLKARGDSCFHVSDEQASVCRFIDSKVISFNGNRIAANRFVISLQTTDALPVIKGLDSIEILRSSTDLSGRSGIQSALIYGSDEESVNTAFIIAKRGIKTTLLGSEDRLLPMYDPSVSEYSERILSRANVRVINGVTPLTVAGDKTRTYLIGEKAGEPFRIVAGCLIICAKTNETLPDIGLGNAGVRFQNERPVLGKAFKAPKTHLQVLPASPMPLALIYSCLGIARIKTTPLENLASFQFEPFSATSIGVTEYDLVKHKQPILKAVSMLTRPDGTHSGFIKLLMNVKGRLIGASLVSDSPQGRDLVLKNAVKQHQKPLTLLNELSSDNIVDLAIAEAVERLVL